MRRELGFAFAFANCALFVCYVVLGHRIAGGAGEAGGTAMAGIDRLGASMLAAAVVATPIGLGGALPAFAHPALLLAGVGVGICSSVVPYVTDQLAMRKLFGQRDDYLLATKVYYPMGPGPGDRGLSRKHVLAAIDASLRRLGADHVDLYQIHRWDDETPIEETMEALRDVVRTGKARYLGASSMYAWQFAKAQFTAQAGGWTRFVAMQNHYNLVYREEEREMIPLCVDQGIGVVPYSPLARGLLSGSRDRGGRGGTVRSGSDPAAGQLYADADFDVVDAVREVAAERGVPPARVALAWLLSRPAVTAPIVGATKLAHLDDAIAALDLHLTSDEIARLEAPYRPHPVLGHS